MSGAQKGIGSNTRGAKHQLLVEQSPETHIVKGGNKIHQAPENVGVVQGVRGVRRLHIPHSAWLNCYIDPPPGGAFSIAPELMRRSDKQRKAATGSEQEIDSLIHTIRIYIGMSSGLDKCGRMVSKRGELEQAFGYYGPLRTVWIARNPPGFAFVEFEDPREADDAIGGLDGKSICGSCVEVKLSTGSSRPPHFEQPPTRRPFDPNDKCYECGEKGHYAYDCHRYSRGSRRSRFTCLQRPVTCGHAPFL
ncbi:uncharacterized protein LOC127352619 [Dicentrarchus labrax]|uniref:uncharacterized protein LOC127352619 n=1 Tax=Dicentrarchus labrax TaxID=13489 RepID=UPI0021F53520|nr:uncharacterized protein LOC127352619 [Dicentrarchus labrax]